MEKVLWTRTPKLARRTITITLIMQPQSVEEIVESESLNGLGATILVFLRKRNLSESMPQDNINRFAAVITAEFSNDEEERKTYPLSKSIKQEVFWALEQGKPSFKALYDHGEEENLRKLIRTIVCGETLNVMQDCIEEVMKTFSES